MASRATPQEAVLACAIGSLARTYLNTNLTVAYQEALGG